MDKLNELKNKLDEYNRAYELGNQLVTDDVYNDLISEIQRLEKQQLNEVSTFDAAVADDDTLLEPMLSLQKTYNRDTLINFLTNNIGDSRLFVEPKLDGVSMVLKIRTHQLVGATLKTKKFNKAELLKLPVDFGTILTVNYFDVCDDDIRGEVIMKVSSFHGDQNEYTNPRSAVAGTLNRIVAPENITGIQFIAFRSTSGFKYPSVYWVESIQMSLDELSDFLDNPSTIPDDFIIDGFVFKLPDIPTTYTKRFPKNEIALKFIDKSVETKVTDIIKEYNGKKTKLSVVALLEPIRIGSTLIKRVNIGSERVLEELDIKKGSVVEIALVGNIIPKIVKVIKP